MEFVGGGDEAAAWKRDESTDGGDETAASGRVEFVGGRAGAAAARLDGSPGGGDDDEAAAAEWDKLVNDGDEVAASE